MPTYDRNLTNSQIRVIVDAAKTSYTVITIPYTDDTVSIAEGRFIAIDATTKKGRLALDTDTAVFLNFLASDMTSVLDSQADATGDGTAVPVEGGGLAGIVGTGFLVGLYEAEFTTTPAVGDYIVMDAGGLGKITPTAAPGSGVISFGVVVKINVQGRHWFTFNSTGIVWP